MLCTVQWCLVWSFEQYSGVKYCAMYTSVGSSVVLCTEQWCQVLCFVHISKVSCGALLASVVL